MVGAAVGCACTPEKGRVWVVGPDGSTLPPAREGRGEVGGERFVVQAVATTACQTGMVDDAQEQRVFDFLHRPRAAPRTRCGQWAALLLPSTGCSPRLRVPCSILHPPPDTPNHRPTPPPRRRLAAGSAPRAVRAPTGSLAADASRSWAPHALWRPLVRKKASLPFSRPPPTAPARPFRGQSPDARRAAIAPAATIDTPPRGYDPDCT